MDLLAALFVFILGALGGWASHEQWLERKSKKDMPFALNLRCPVHGLVVNYKASDEFAAIRMMEKWDENHGSCVQTKEE